MTTRPQDNVPPEVVDTMSWHDVKRVDDHGEGLTQREIDFIDSLLGWLRAGFRLSTKQRARLDILLEEKTP